MSLEIGLMHSIPLATGEKAFAVKIYKITNSPNLEKTALWPKLLFIFF
jgi:hypothetical protein